MSKKKPPQPKTAAQAMKMLEKGNANYVVDELTHKYQDVDRRMQQKDRQDPWAVVLTCADSRVTPEFIFDSGIGQLFVIRVAGNIANTSTIASIEYAVANLPVKVVIVLGHEDCGAVKAALANPALGYSLNHLLAHIKPALGKFASLIGKKKIPAAKVTAVVEENARAVAEELKERSEIIRTAKGVKVVPAIYRVKTGEVDYL